MIILNDIYIILYSWEKSILIFVLQVHFAEFDYETHGPEKLSYGNYKNQFL